jgi:hypothetical protein
MCEHDYHWRDRPDDIGDCTIHVDCDEGCKALTDPVTLDEVKAALEHWRDHMVLSGCSHGC